MSCTAFIGESSVEHVWVVRFGVGSHLCLTSAAHSPFDHRILDNLPAAYGTPDLAAYADGFPLGGYAALENDPNKVWYACHGGAQCTCPNNCTLA